MLLRSLPNRAEVCLPDAAEATATAAAEAKLGAMWRGRRALALPYLAPVRALLVTSGSLPAIARQSTAKGCNSTHLGKVINDYRHLALSYDWLFRGSGSKCTGRAELRYARGNSLQRRVPMVCPQMRTYELMEEAHAPILYFWAEVCPLLPKLSLD